MGRSFSILVALAGTAAADCPHPHATLDGDPAAVASVTIELVKLGVDVGPPIASTCKSVSATVRLDRDQIAVAVKTGSQSEGRTVSDAALAATWIDSWLADDDFGGPMFQTKLASARVVTANPDVIATLDAPRAQADLGIAVSAAFDQAWMFDGSRWTGVTGGVCAQVGAFCVGARGRYAAESELFRQTAASRTDLSVLATASYEKRIGRAKLMPELGLGLGRMSTTRIDGCRHVQTCNPEMDPNCMEPPPDEDCIARDPEHAYTLDVGDSLKVTLLNSLYLSHCSGF